MRTSDTPSGESFWNDTTRGIVSVLLVGHLFALALIWLSNNDYGMDQTDGYIPSVKNYANPYLSALWLNRRWDQRLTTGEDLDSDFRIRLIAANKDGQTKVVDFPNPDESLPEMRERWQEMAREFAKETFVGNEEAVDRRALAFGKAWLTRERADGRNWDTLEFQGLRRNRVTIDNPTLDPLAAQNFGRDMRGGDGRPVKILAVKVTWPAGKGDASLSHLGGEARDQRRW
ncbi:MAG: hypothetical protein QM811_00560 [Pirellulales bacterium]